jgi:RNA polymerase sigma-70 factor (ECF subfamily)
MRHGDKDALRKVYQKYKDDLLTVAACLLVDMAAAEDVLQDVFVDFAGGIGQFRLRSNLKGYLATCVANRARDELRRRSRQQARHAEEADPPSPSPGPASQLSDIEEAQRLQRALTGLPDEQREVITLHLHGDLTFKEIAEHLEVSINTVQSRYRYGLQKLRSLLSAGVEA